MYTHNHQFCFVQWKVLKFMLISMPHRLLTGGAFIQGKKKGLAGLDELSKENIDKDLIEEKELLGELTMLDRPL